LVEEEVLLPYRQRKKKEYKKGRRSIEKGFERGNRQPLPGNAAGAENRGPPRCLGPFEKQELQRLRPSNNKLETEKAGKAGEKRKGLEKKVRKKRGTASQPRVEKVPDEKNSTKTARD